MKLASFFFLSLGLHATALVYPLSFYAPIQADLIDVTILPTEPESGGAEGQGGSGIPSRPGHLKSRRATPPVVASRIESDTRVTPAPRILPAEATAKLSDSRVASIAAMPNPTLTNGTAVRGSTINDEHGSAVGLGRSAGGNEFGSSGTGSGQAIGNGNGSHSSGSGAALTQARYRDAPRPDYPESARRDGREGSVLLRVLVDDLGRSKKIEILNSSGSETLDRAAAEAIKRWRFHPARYGDKAVESWLRIPIEFRLADTNSW